MDFNASLGAFNALHTDYGWVLNTGLLVFARVLTFFHFAPVINRKDVFFNAKMGLALTVTVMLLWMVPQDQIPTVTPTLSQFMVLILLNIFVGGFIGTIADIIFKAIAAAGSMMNNQIGLSSAMIFDSSSRAQVMLLDRFFAILGTVLFLNIGGMYWLLDALKRTITVFPVYNYTHPFTQLVDFDYLTMITANTIVVAVQLVAPVIVVTLAIDIMLGVVNRTAQQMPVFQLSFALKPSIGVGVLLATMPIFIEAIIHYLQDFSQIFQ